MKSFQRRVLTGIYEGYTTQKHRPHEDKGIGGGRVPDIRRAADILQDVESVTCSRD